MGNSEFIKAAVALNYDPENECRSLVEWFKVNGTISSRILIDYVGPISRFLDSSDDRAKFYRATNDVQAMFLLFYAESLED